MNASKKLTFDQWWSQQPLASQPDTARVAYLRDMAQRVWISAQDAMQDPVVEPAAAARRDTTYLRRPPSLLTYADLVKRAEYLFLENTYNELKEHTFQHLCRAVEVEEDDRKHGMRPNYRIDDVPMCDE